MDQWASPADEPHDQEATVNRYHYDSHNQLRAHLVDFVTAYNFARRLKILKGLSPYEYICSTWTKESGRFILNPIHQMPGLNTIASTRQSNHASTHRAVKSSEPASIT